MCEKRQFSKKEAQGALNQIKRNTRDKNSKECRIYNCPDCGWWHLTKKQNGLYECL